MKSALAEAPKEKVTVTLNPRLLRAVDQWCKKSRVKSRSAAIEHLLDQSIREDEKRRLESETETYYRSLSSSEREEDKAWAKSSSVPFSSAVRSPEPFRKRFCIGFAALF